MFKMMKKKSNKWLVIPMVLMIFIASTTTVFAASKTLSVTQVIQAKSNWCWAACSEMVGKYQNSSSTRDQWSVVNYVKNSTSYPNNGGTDAELVKGIRYASSDTVTYQYSSSPLSFASHQTNIDGSNPLVVWMKWSPTSAHVVVCAGYKTTTTNNYLYLVDPIEDTTKAYYDYAHLKNGTSIQSGTGTYDHTIYKK